MVFPQGTDSKTHFIIFFFDKPLFNFQIAKFIFPSSEKEMSKVFPGIGDNFLQNSYVYIRNRRTRVGSFFGIHFQLRTYSLLKIKFFSESKISLRLDSRNQIYYKN